MTDEQFAQMMAALTSIDKRLSLLVSGAQQDHNVMQSLVDQLVNDGPEKSTDAYYSQRLLGGPGFAGM